MTFNSVIHLSAKFHMYPPHFTPVTSGLNMEDVYFSETLASTYEATRRQYRKRKHQNLTHCRENLKSNLVQVCRIHIYSIIAICCNC
jgi:hypothetical protein